MASGGKVSKAASSPRSKKLTHIGSDGRAAMVDVGDKAETSRRAVAEGFVSVSAELASRIRLNTLAKGNLLEVARLAGVMAAKKTDELVPLCHSLPLDHISVEATLTGKTVHLRAEARTVGRTGVEMEAYVAVAIAALTVVDMGKAVDQEMVIGGIRLLEKSGGRSGDFRARSLRSAGLKR